MHIVFLISWVVTQLISSPVDELLSYVSSAYCWIPDGFPPGISLLFIASKHLMLGYEYNHVIIDQSILFLISIHQCLFANTIDHAWYTGWNLVDFVDCRFSKDIFCTSGIGQMRSYVFTALGTIQRQQCTVHIYALTDRCIGFKFKLFGPKFGLPN